VIGDSETWAAASAGASFGLNQNETRLGGVVETGRLLLTDKVTITLEKGKDGKFEAKTQSWDRNEVFKPGDQLRVEVVSSGQLALTRWHSETKAKKLAAAAPVPPKAVAGGLGRAIATASQ
jgi:hypothetical protein